MTTEPPDDYLAARIEEAIAADPRVSELHVRVGLRGDRVYLTGTVTTEQRRHLVSEIARDLASGREICNETTVVEAGEAGEERLS